MERDCQMHEKDAKSILSAQNGMNLYRGCTHGCIYCDSRSNCYHFGHEFEDIEIKRNAPLLLEEALNRKRRRCMIGTGSMCDPYLPLERERCLTQECLSIIERHGFGVTVLTKSDLILRDLDLLRRIHQKARCVVQMTLTTYDEALCHLLEPHVSSTHRRYEVLKILQQEGIPTVVWLCPILPFINDTEENLRGILHYCFDAGVKGILCFGMGLTLRDGNREYFYQKLDESFPGMKERYIRAFGASYSCESPRNAQLMSLFHRECATNDVLHSPENIFRYLNQWNKNEEETGEQMSLF